MRIIRSAFVGVILGLLLAGTHSAYVNWLQSVDAAQTYQVIGSGDSISLHVFPNVAVGQTRWLNREPSRAPYTPGVPPSLTCGTTCYSSTLSASTVQTITWALASSAPGGYVIVQDGGHADKNGVITTDGEYRDFVEDIVAVIPNDRTLVFVYPGYDASINCASCPVGYQNLSQTANRRAQIARDVFNNNPAQPVATVNWWYAVSTHPIGSANPYVLADGLHPTAAGSAWLAQQLNQVVC